MSAHDERLAALSHLDGAHNDIIRARRELRDFQRGMRLLGMDVDNSVDCALNAISSATEHVRAARCTLSGAVCDEMKGR